MTADFLSAVTSGCCSVSGVMWLVWYWRRRRAEQKWRVAAERVWLYGRNGDHGVERAPVRGWRSDIYAALKELHPEAATWMLYGADPEMGDETT